MKITVIGSGAVGRSVAAGFASGGHDVILSSRTPETLTAWSAETGIGVSRPADSLEDAELVVNATPGMSSIEALSGAQLGSRHGVVVLDLCNPLDLSTGAPRLATSVDESMAEAIQAAFPEAHVVKTLNTVNAEVMTHPGTLAEPSLQFVCGNNAAAKAAVVGLLAGCGWHADQIIDLGDLTAARVTERYLMLWLRLMGSLGSARFNIRLVRE